jgi:CheY-like chemotaxis protein
LVEILEITPGIKELIYAGGPAAEIEAAARADGMRTLRDVGVARVQAGETTLQELERVLGDVGRATAADAAADTNASTEGPAPTDGEEAQAGQNPETERSVDPVPAPQARAPDSGAEEVDDGAAPPVLLVDDDSANRTIAKALLESEGYTTAEAADGLEAVELLKSGQPFSLVVLDLEMPRMNGDEVLKEIRGSMATVGFPVIVLTGTSDPDAELKLMEAGADDYIRKPFDPRRFMIRVKAALRRAGLVGF